jgi:hypothetical protein
MDVVSWTLPTVDKDLGVSQHEPSWRGPAWNWQHDLKPDPQLAAAALEESAFPVLPGEPGKKDFWTWRVLARSQPPHQVSVIYPPCFDLQETPGAAKYRLEVKQKGDQGKTLSFEADKPWRPLAPIWKDLPSGEYTQYTLAVKALDAAGRELPGPMRMGVGNPVQQPGNWAGKPIEPYRPGRIVVETGPIAFTKRPCFAGPYSTRPAQSWTQAALAMAAWAHAEGRSHHGMLGPGALSRRGLAPGDWNGFNCYDFSAWMQVLTLRALAEDAGQRLQAEQLLRFACERRVNT